MHRALIIPEILQVIFEGLEPGSNTLNAQVCKDWLNIALDAVWKEAEPKIFLSLAPAEISADEVPEIVSDQALCFPIYWANVLRFSSSPFCALLRSRNGPRFSRTHIAFGSGSSNHSPPSTPFPKQPFGTFWLRVPCSASSQI